MYEDFMSGVPNLGYKGVTKLIDFDKKKTICFKTIMLLVLSI